VFRRPLQKNLISQVFDWKKWFPCPSFGMKKIYFDEMEAYRLTPPLAVMISSSTLITEDWTARFGVRIFDKLF